MCCHSSQQTPTQHAALTRIETEPAGAQVSYDTETKLARAGPMEDSFVDSFRAALAARTAYASAAAEDDAAAGSALAAPPADASPTKARAAAQAAAASATAEEESDVTAEGSTIRRADGWQRSLSQVGLRSSAANPNVLVARPLSAHR